MFRRTSSSRGERAVATLERLVERDPDACVTRPGLEAASIAAREEAKQIKLPREVKELLERTNGVDFHGRRFVIFGVHEGSAPFDFGDLFEATEWHRGVSGLADNDIVLGQEMAGCLAVARKRGETWRFEIVDLEDAEVLRSFETLGGLLEGEFEYWREIKETS